jgi:hypothetical protein
MIGQIQKSRLPRPPGGTETKEHDNAREETMDQVTAK